MTSRHIDAVHLIVTRVCNGGTEILLSPHPRWGRLALPAKKVQIPSRLKNVSRAGLRSAALALRGELGIRQTGVGRLLPQVGLAVQSPTAGVLTDYRIAPLALPAHDRMALVLRGEWLTVSQALAESDLTATARAVIEGLCEVDEANLFAIGEVDEWTRRLAEARLDESGFGNLFNEMRPWLADKLKRDHKTRAISSDENDVDEALAEAMRKAVLGLPAFDPARGPARAWMWRITRNEGVGVLRGRGSSHTQLGGLEGMVGGSSSEDPAERLAERETVAKVYEQLESELTKFPKSVQEGLRLVFTGTKYQDAAEQTGAPQGTLASAAHKVRAALKRGMSL